MLLEDTSELPLVHVALWCFGEYGEFLVEEPPEGRAATIPLSEPIRKRTESEINEMLNRLIR